MNSRKAYLTCLTLLAVLCTVSDARAESDVRDLESVAFAPNNTVVALGYFRHETSTDDLHTLDSGTFRGLYLMRFGNLVLVPVDLAVGAADYTAYRSASLINPALGALNLAVRGAGFTDLTYLPSLSYVFPESGINHTVIQFNPRISLPTGNYDSTRAINIGEHRVTFTPYLGIAQRFASNFTAEAYGFMAIHSQNSSFEIPAMGTTAAINTSMSQSPNFGLDVHLGADLSRTFFLAASYYLLQQGSLKFGISQIPEKKEPLTQSLRFAFGIRIEKGTLLLLQFDQDISASNGGEINRWFGARISHAFSLNEEPSKPAPAQ
jgi:hypothetical protein